MLRLLKFFKRSLFCATTLILASGCGPQYANVHKISNPTSKNQALCAKDCDRVGNICAKMCHQNEARCFDLQRHSVRGGYNHNPYDYFNSNHFYNCDFVLETCMRDCSENKLLCYSNCGLTISSNKICVENCDE